MTKEEIELLKDHAEWLMEPPCGDLCMEIARTIFKMIDEYSKAIDWKEVTR